MKTTGKFSIIAIASSTGGPGVLRAILPGIAESGLPILVTQHINQDFADQFAVWLEGEIGVRVKFAVNGEKLTGGTVILAPPDIHLAVNNYGKVQLLDAPKLNFQKPSADHMFFSIAKVYRESAMGIILTGMGRDGADGILKIKESGGYTIAQDQASSVVFGMPREAIKLDAACDVLPFQDIPAMVMRVAGKTVSG